ncbi:MAG: MBOAT family protein [Halioglobus sp.]|nr:MBOAT family protein [Halioglobus sp.]
MLFNSIEFLFFFLPLVLAVFLLLQRFGNLKAIIIWLIASSLFFYAWWNTAYVLLLMASMVVNYCLGSLLARSREDSGGLILAVGLLFNLGLLGYLKYANFFMDNMRLAMDWDFNFEYIILPLAISFYTFQQITYLVDLRKGLAAPHGFIEYCLFVSFFPQLIAGPIVHHSEMISQYDRLTDASQRTRNLTIGFSIIAIGLFKKVVIADGFGLFATPVFDIAYAGGNLHALDAVVGMFSYAFQLYFDFSGYCDMAIGLGCLFGIKLPVNFFSPYRAQNISDFWRMWHATLSRFLRDYVYAPLGGFMCSPRRQRLNLFATMFVGGIWHGAGWTFIVYGMLHGTFVVTHQLWRIHVSGPARLLNRREYKIAAQVFTFLVVCLSLVVFRAETITAAVNVYSAMLNWNGFAFAPDYLERLNASRTLTISSLVGAQISREVVVMICLLLALAVCWILPSTYQLFRQYDVCIDKPLAGRESVLVFRWKPTHAWAVFTAILLFLSLLNLTQKSEFLYFQF